MLHIVIGVLIGLLAVYQIYTGRMVVGDTPGDNSAILRSEKPIYFWAMIGVEGLLAAALIFGLINF
jgi:hypothetical protein